jgi:hypothetical protein
MTTAKRPKSARARRRLDELIEEAIVDAYGEEEHLTGLFTMIEENLTLPFETEVLGVRVVVRRIDLADNRVLAICEAGRRKQRVSFDDLPRPTTEPVGWEWVEAYREWRRRNFG